MPRRDECPHCHAPAPVRLEDDTAGEIEHPWDCPALGKPRRYDWDTYTKSTAAPVADTVFTPLPPLATLPAGERAALKAFTRQVAEAWIAAPPRRRVRKAAA